MIIVKLAGGMGNQMFEYAFGRALSLKYNIPLKIDLSFLKRRDMGAGFVYRDYDLDLFNVNADFEIKPEDIQNLIRIGEPHFHYSELLVKRIDEIFTGKDLNLPPESFNIERNILIDGYWQSPKYFLDSEERIRKDMTFRNPIENSEDEKVIAMLGDIKNSNSVMVNIRRTDYLNTNFHGVLGNDFIDGGTKIIESKVEDPKYFVFSDDVEWCENNIKLDNVVFVDHYYKGDRFSYYLQLMINCKHFIVPNSTFAWWAAWLNESSDKIVIAPKNWFTDPNINTNDIIPENWIRI